KTVLPHASQTVDTHMLAFRYRPSDDMSVYVKAASGFRPSSGNFPLADILTGDPIAPVVLAADTLWSYDLGVKGNLADGMFTYDIAVWQSDWKNFQSSIFNGVATSSRNYAGSLKSRGIDGAIGFNLMDGLNVNLNATYTDSELSHDDGLLGAVKGERYPNVPKWTAAGRASYTFSATDTVDITLNGGFRYIGESMSTFSKSTQSTPVLIKGYTVADVSVNFTYNDQITSTFYVANITNSDAVQSRNDAIASMVTTAIRTKPRTIGFNLGYEF
ncbi:MAG: TonB-dependent receptor, partial [Emcibacteraceae bacterium]|nr:TonB-dependent receptor [Emcibacteraceae bacterium]